MREQALKLIQYDHWANVKILAALSEAIDPPPRALELFSHLLAVSSIWLSRVKSESDAAKRFDVYTLQECEILNNRLVADWTDFLQAQASDSIVNFQLLGKEYHMSVLDFVNHVSMHGSYHRGQVVTLLKGHLDPLPMTDYVLFAIE